METIIRDTINTGRFNLTELIRKINKLYVEDVLTDAQRDELIAQAQSHADPHQSYGKWQDAIDGIMENIRALTERVTALDGGASSPPPEDEYPPYTQRYGHNPYQVGDKMTYTDGKRYINKQPNNVYPPDVMPSYWELVP